MAFAVGSDVCRPGPRSHLAVAGGVAIVFDGGDWPQGLWILLSVEGLRPGADMGLGRRLAFWFDGEGSADSKTAMKWVADVEVRWSMAVGGRGKAGRGGCRPPPGGLWLLGP